MPNSNEVNQAQMDLNMLTLFNYVTQGISSDIKLDYVMLDEVELNFDD